MALELVKSAQTVTARITLWAGAAGAGAAIAAMIGATLAKTIAAVPVGLAFGVRQALAKMEVGIANSYE